MKLSAIMAFLAILLCVPAGAQNNNGGNTLFDSKLSCGAALTSKSGDIYDPTFLGNYNVNFPDDKVTFAIPLDSDACIHALTMGGWHWIIQKKNTPQRFRKNPDGTFTIYAVHKCGNPADDMYIPMYIPVQPMQVEGGGNQQQQQQIVYVREVPTPAPQAVPAPRSAKCGDPGIRYDPVTGPCEQATAKCGDPGVKFDPFTGPCGAAPVVAEKKESLCKRHTAGCIIVSDILSAGIGFLIGRNNPGGGGGGGQGSVITLPAD